MVMTPTLPAAAEPPVMLPLLRKIKSFFGYSSRLQLDAAVNAWVLQTGNLLVAAGPISENRDGFSSQVIFVPAVEGIDDPGNTKPVAKRPTVVSDVGSLSDG